MKYSEGSIGRVFVVKFEHGDDFLKELNDFVKEKEIKSGTIQFIGALNNSEFVVGPKENVVPPEPIWKSFNDGREVLGVGTIFWDRLEPKIHIHASIGREDKVNLGCIRKNTNVYLVIEAIIFEITGTAAKKVKDEKTGLYMLEF